MVVTSLDGAVAALLREADEAYCHGLFRATLALCRAVLEDVIKRVVEARGVQPIRDDLQVLIDCIPPRLWSPRARQVAHEIRDIGNRAMHESDAQFSEDDAWRVLVCTTRLLQVLINRGGLRTEAGR